MRGGEPAELAARDRARSISEMHSSTPSEHDGLRVPSDRDPWRRRARSALGALAVGLALLGFAACSNPMALEDEMRHAAPRQVLAHRQPGLAAADDERGNSFDRHFSVLPLKTEPVRCVSEHRGWEHRHFAGEGRVVRRRNDIGRRAVLARTTPPPG